MDRVVVVVYGMPFTGKSWLVERIPKEPGFEKAVVMRMDDIRVRLYGNRADLHITKSEHLFKNELARQAILEKLVLGEHLIVAETSMYTVEGHQRPFVEMIARAEKYVQAIEHEYAVRDKVAPPEVPSKVRLCVVMLHALLERIKKRIETGYEDRKKSNAAVFDLEGTRGAFSGMQFPSPDLYQPLLLDMSNESADAQAERMSDLRTFVKAGTLPDDTNMRWKMFRVHHNQSREALGISPVPIE